MTKENIWDPEVEVEKSSYNSKGDPKHLKSMKERENAPNHPMIDLFCGAGGFSTGLSMAGFDVVLGVDIHVPSIETFQFNHKFAHAILGDIREANDKLLEKAIKEASLGKEIELITAGIPCQGFSIANRKQNDEDERNYLFKEFLRVVDLTNPKFIIVENVPTMKKAKDGEFVETIKKALNDNYNVETRVLNSKKYQVPQQRKRLFFMGVRKDLDIQLDWPVENDEEISVWEAISDLPKLKVGESASKYKKMPQNNFQQLMRSNNKVLKNHKAPNHRQVTIDRISSTKPGEPMYEKFRQRVRLHPDKPAPTIISGGIRPQFQYGHPSQIRGLTVRERARLQSFPDFFEFKGGMVQGRVLTGQAVPPLLAKSFGDNIFQMKNKD
jgi:DNA (cytosine-5)-methyltransferase 1